MNFQHLTTKEQVEELMQYHNTFSKYVVMDTETTGLNSHVCELICITMSGRYGETVFFYRDFVDCLHMLDKSITLVLHNFKYDNTVLSRYGVDLLTYGIHDTMLVDHLIDENNREHGLEAIIVRDFGVDQAYKKDFWKTYSSFQEAPLAEQVNYACSDIVYTDKIYQSQQGKVEQRLVDHVHKLAKTLAQTERDGLNIDLTYLTDIATELKPKIDHHKISMREQLDNTIDSLEHDMWAEEIKKAFTPKGKKWQTLPKPDFNFDSNKQLGALLYDKLKLPEQLSKKKTRTVDDEALDKLESLHPIIGQIKELRTYRKVYTAFIEGTLDKVQNGRIYPSFNVIGTVTGRISSSEPNMQQLPSKGDWAKVRGIYTPDTGHKLVTCDYSQLEVVIAAHYSQDKNLLRIINEGASKHDITAEGVGVPRGMAKTLNFAMQYGCTPMKVKTIANCSDKQAQKIWDKYWETYAGEKAVVDECARKVDAGEPIINPFGRIRRFPTKFEKVWHKQSAYRQSYSSLIQGTGADCTNWATYTVDQHLRENGLGKVLFSIHDEIVIQAKDEHVEQATEALKFYMVLAGKIANLSVPLSVEASKPLERWEK